MARPKLTEEQKAANKQHRDYLKKLERENVWRSRQEEWAKAAEESRQRVLLGISPELGKRFLHVVENISTVKNEFVIDVVNKWKQFGNLSERQITLVVSAFERDQDREAVADTVETFFEVDKQFTTEEVTVTFAEETHATSPFGGYDVVFKVRMIQCDTGIRFSFSTNNKKLRAQCKSLLESKTPVKLTATVKWLFDGSDTVILSSKGMKLEI